MHSMSAISKCRLDSRRLFDFAVPTLSSNQNQQPLMKHHQYLLFLALTMSALTASAADHIPPAATPVERMKVPKDFKVELLYNVPKDTQGSWVNLCVDPKGRLITSDQYGDLYRITPPTLGGNASDTKVEKLDLKIGEAQ